MTAAYDQSLIQFSRRSADSLGIALKSGVYAGLKGPSLETPAEIRYLKTIGADAVGFSTVMETIVAVHAGMRVLGFSTITNINDPDRPAPASVEAIVAAANRAAPDLNRLILAVVAQIHRGCIVMTTTADLLITNGIVLTMDPDGRMSLTMGRWRSAGRPLRRSVRQPKSDRRLQKRRSMPTAASSCPA
jgi:hypothetical protein